MSGFRYKGSTTGLIFIDFSAGCVYFVFVPAAMFRYCRPKARVVCTLLARTILAIPGNKCETFRRKWALKLHTKFGTHQRINFLDSHEFVFPRVCRTTWGCSLKED